MTKIKALINLVVSPKKEISIGQEYDLNEADALKLAERGFVKILKKAQTASDKPTNPSNDEKGQENGSTPQKSGG